MNIRDVSEPVPRASPLDLEQVVDIAVALFLHRGYDGTSMSDIAKAAGVRKATLYYHVSSKEELLRRGSQRSLIAYRAMLEADEFVDAVERLLNGELMRGPHARRPTIP